MTPQELKASILQLAIQGKLVEQRPEEGSGEELYKQIQAEKQKLIKDGKIKKGKSLPEITVDEIPFDIPENWIWVRLGTIVKSISAGGDKPSAFSKNKSTEYTVPVISNGETNKGIYGYTNKAEILERSLTVSGRGTIGYAEIRTEPFLPIVRLLVIIPLEHTYLEYIKVAIQASAEYGIGSAVKQLTVPMISPKLIPLPPLAEQQRIVAKIEELLPYIDRYEKAWNRLEEFNKRFPADMQKSILQMAIQGKLVEQRPEEGTAEELYKQIQEEKKKLIKAGKIKKEKPLPEITEDEIPFDIPESWKWVRVAQIVTLNPKNDIDNNIDTSFVPMSCVSDGFRNTHTFEVKKWGAIKKGFTHFANGDIGIAKITPCFQNRKSVVFRDLINGYGAGTTELSIVRVINNTVLREYLLWFFKTEYFIANGVKSFTGTAGQQRIHKDYLATSLLPLPHLAEQKRIVAKLEEILPLCEKLKQC